MNDDDSKKIDSQKIDVSHSSEKQTFFMPFVPFEILDRGFVEGHNFQ
jgi:hypothetical protein